MPKLLKQNKAKSKKTFFSRYVTSAT
jgi:hypothetical protein